MPSHRIVGSEVGRRTTPGGGSIRMMTRSRKRRLRGWGIVVAPITLLIAGVAAVFLWPFR